eukprot:560139-Pelagomonas_calceolata.AAC.2
MHVHGHKAQKYYKAKGTEVLQDTMRKMATRHEAPKHSKTQCAKWLRGTRHRNTARHNAHKHREQAHTSTVNKRTQAL